MFRKTNVERTASYETCNPLMLRVQMQHFDWLTKNLKKPYCAHQKPSCKSDFIMCASDETVTVLAVLEKMGVQPLGKN